jgi:hypothetical protein
MDMKRVAILFLVAVVFALAPAAVSAQGLIGAGLPGMPSLFGGYAGGPSACGEKCGGLAAGTNLYVGWMDDAKGVTAKFTPEGIPLPTLAAVNEISQQYPVRGLWLGLTQSVPLSENLAIVGSGWYLIPSDRRSTEAFNLPGFTLTYDWGSKSQWWFVDGLLAYGGGNVQLLAGFRYDYFTTKFSDPSPPFFVVGFNDTADVKSEGFIPLFGVQYAQAGGNSNLLFRIVGVPTLLGNISYRQSVINTAASLEGKGNYNGGYFLEAFAQYGWSLGGMGNMGVFGRYNVTGGHSVLSFDLLPLAQSADYRLGLNRYTWTFGGEFSLNFSIPYM